MEGFIIDLNRLKFSMHLFHWLNFQQIAWMLICWKLHNLNISDENRQHFWLDNWTALKK